MPSIPFAEPLYPDPPVEYRGARLAVAYLEGSLPPGMLPRRAEAAETPLRLALFADYPDSTIGPYREVALLGSITLEGSAALFCALIYVTTDVALAQGREVWGFPKKLAEIDFENDGNQVTARLARNGKMLAELRGTAADEMPVDTMADLASMPIINQKWIPSPSGKDADVDILTSARMDQDLDHAWVGTATLDTYGEAAAALGPSRDVTLARMSGNLVLHPGEVVA